MERVDPAVRTIAKKATTLESTVAPPQQYLQRPRIGLEYVASQLITSLPLLMADALAIMAPMLAWSLLGLPLPALSICLCVIVAIVATYAMLGLYPGIGLHPSVELKRCSAVSTVALTLLVASLVAAGMAPLAIVIRLAIAAPVALVCVPVFRSVARRLAARSDRWTQPVIIFGSGQQSADIYKAMDANRRSGLRPLGFVDEIEAQWVDTSMDPNWYLGTPHEAVDIAARDRVHWAVVSGSVDMSRENQRTIELFASAIPHRLYASGISPRIVNASIQTRSFGSVSMLYQWDLLALPIQRVLKRILDLVISLAVAVVALPLMLIIGILVKCTSRGPVFYAHQRLGLHGKTFMTLKFRTMRADASEVLQRYLAEHPHLRAEWEAKHKLTEDPRVTRMGRLLRKSSLDELPQLFNVLRGDMSLVGPRPIVVSEISRYDDAYEYYCQVLPGIAGLWQVSGRNDTTYEDRVAYDVSYVQNWSPWLDIYLLARTIKVVLTQDGAY